MLYLSTVSCFNDLPTLLTPTCRLPNVILLLLPLHLGRSVKAAVCFSGKSPRVRVQMCTRSGDLALTQCVLFAVRVPLFRPSVAAVRLSDGFCGRRFQNPQETGHGPHTHTAATAAAGPHQCVHCGNRSHSVLFAERTTSSCAVCRMPLTLKLSLLPQIEPSKPHMAALLTLPEPTRLLLTRSAQDIYLAERTRRLNRTDRCIDAAVRIARGENIRLNEMSEMRTRAICPALKYVTQCRFTTETRCMVNCPG